jgi:hypothetical protein
MINGTVNQADAEVILAAASPTGVKGAESAATAAATDRTHTSAMADQPEDGCAVLTLPGGETLRLPLLTVRGWGTPARPARHPRRRARPHSVRCDSGAPPP